MSVRLRSVGIHEIVTYGPNPPSPAPPALALDHIWLSWHLVLGYTEGGNVKLDSICLELSVDRVHVAIQTAARTQEGQPSVDNHLDVPELRCVHAS
jgi:hypothetical protein